MFLLSSMRRRGSSSILAVAAIPAVLSCCASRPTSAVLQPVVVKSGHATEVSVLAVTNRDWVRKDDSFGNRWAASTSYDRFTFLVPPKREGVTIRYLSQKPDPNRQYVVTKREKLTRARFLRDVVNSPKFDGTAGIVVHGYNYSYQEALFRTTQMAADAGEMAAPIMFSWPSAASVTGYVTDRDSVLYSRTELGALLTALANKPKVKRVVLFGHSMGGFLSMEATRQLKLQGREDLLSKLQIILAAPDIDVDVFKAQLRDIGHLRNPITLLVSNSDRALGVSSLVGGERPRVGRMDINDPLIQEAAKAEHLQVIDISSLQSSDGLGHDRYAALARYSGIISENDAKLRRGGGNIGAFVFDAAGAAVASPFRLVGQLAGH